MGHLPIVLLPLGPHAAALDTFLAALEVATPAGRPVRLAGDAWTAHACARMPPLYPQLPAAVPHTVALRVQALARAGGIDSARHDSGYAAPIDLSLWLAGQGWPNVLGEGAFAARRDKGSPAKGDMDAIAARWPAFNAQLAQCLMDDPLHPLPEQLIALHTQLAGLEPQHDLFG